MSVGLFVGSMHCDASIGLYECSSARGGMAGFAMGDCTGQGLGAVCPARWQSMAPSGNVVDYNGDCTGMFLLTTGKGEYWMWNQC